MARYIDADKLINKYEQAIDDDWNKRVAPSSWSEAYDCVIADIDDCPTADVQEVKHGKWLYENYECSLCGESLRSIMDSDSYFSGDFNGCNYCPNCGAKLKGVIKCIVKNASKK